MWGCLGCFGVWFLFLVCFLGSVGLWGWVVFVHFYVGLFGCGCGCMLGWLIWGEAPVSSLVSRGRREVRFSSLNLILLVSAYKLGGKWGYGFFMC